MRRVSLVCLSLAAMLAAACTDTETAKQRAFESGNRYFDEKKYPEAIVEYRNAVRADPRFGEARLKLAEAYALTGQRAWRVRRADPGSGSAAGESRRAAEGGRLSAADSSVRGRQDRARSGCSPGIPRTCRRSSSSATRRRDFGSRRGHRRHPAGHRDRSRTQRKLHESGGAEAGAGQTARAGPCAFEKAVEVDPRSVQPQALAGHVPWGIERHCRR